MWFTIKHHLCPEVETSDINVLTFWKEMSVKDVWLMLIDAFPYTFHMCDWQCNLSKECAIKGL